MKMTFKILAIAMTFCLAMVGLSVPANAAIVYNRCPESNFCLYQALNFQQNIWHTSINNIHLHTSGGITSCLNISPAAWANGTPVADNSGSLVNNNDTDPAWTHYDTYWFNWVNCNPDGGYDWAPGTPAGISSDDNLSTSHYIGAPGGEYHTITSVEVIPN